MNDNIQCLRVKFYSKNNIYHLSAIMYFTLFFWWVEIYVCKPMTSFSLEALKILKLSAPSFLYKLRAQFLLFHQWETTKESFFLLLIAAFLLYSSYFLCCVVFLRFRVYLIYFFKSMSDVLNIIRFLCFSSFWQKNKFGNLARVERQLMKEPKTFSFQKC